MGVLELDAQLLGQHLVDAGIRLVERAVVLEQLGSGLVAHPGDARDVVGGVALERLEVDHLARRKAVALVDLGRVVDDRGGHAAAGGHQADVVAGQLEHVQVAADDGAGDALRLGLQGERADEVIGLEALQLVDGDAEGGQQLAHDGELLAQVVGCGLAGGLVLGEALVAEGAAEVEAGDDVVGLHVLEASQHDAPEAEDGVDQLALGGRQGRRHEREIGAIDEAVRVQQHEPFHGPSVPAARQLSPYRAP